MPIYKDACNPLQSRKFAVIHRLIVRPYQDEAE